MKRREALRYTAFLAGTSAVVGSSLWWSACKSEPALSWAPEFLSPSEGQLVEELAEFILPETKTIGAKKAGVPQYIDMMLKSVYEPEKSNRFKEGLKAFEDNCVKSAGKSFLELDAAGRGKYVDTVIAEAKKQKEEWDKNPPKEGDPPRFNFWSQFKRMTLEGWTSSEPVNKNVFVYLPIPQDWVACQDLSVTQGKLYSPFN